MSVGIVTAGGGHAWETALVAEAARGGSPVTVVRRCVDMADVLAIAATGQVAVAIVASDLRRLDSESVFDLAGFGVAVVAVHRMGDDRAATSLQRIGVAAAVPDDASPSAIVQAAFSAAGDGPVGAGAGGRRTGAAADPSRALPGVTGGAAARESADRESVGRESAQAGDGAARFATAGADEDRADGSLAASVGGGGARGGDQGSDGDGGDVDAPGSRAGTRRTGVDPDRVESGSAPRSTGARVRTLLGRARRATPAGRRQGTDGAATALRGHRAPRTSHRADGPAVAASTASRGGAVPEQSGPGRVIAVWGPVGAPGRSTVAMGLADRAVHAGSTALVIDADVYGGVLASAFGLLDESAGLAGACRLAAGGRLGAADFAGLCWQVQDRLTLLTGIARADRWPELRPSAIPVVLDLARARADIVIVDCAAVIETDEEISFDTLAPRRNGATVAVLNAADQVLAVGAGDPAGVERLARAHAELAALSPQITPDIVFNRVRSSAASEAELREASRRFCAADPVAFLPEDRGSVDLAWRRGMTLSAVAQKSPLISAFDGLLGVVSGVPARS